MLPLILGNMINSLNTSMLVAAITTICHNFGQEISAGALLTAPLFLAATVCQPLMGKLADVYDPRLVNRGGILLVLIAGIVGSTAPTFYWLVASRVILGIGISAAYPSTIAILSHKYASAGRAIPANLLGIISGSSQVIIVAGPLIGGILSHWFGWQGVFMINIPWALATLYLSKNIEHVDRVREGGTFLKRTDAIGALLFTVMLSISVFSLQNELELHHHIIAGTALLIFIIWELCMEMPFIDIRLFWKNHMLTIVYLRILLANYVLYIILYALPQWLEAVMRLSTWQVGLLMTPLTIMSAASATFISTSLKLRWLNIIAIATMILACSMLFLINHSMPIWEIVAISIVSGMAMGLNIVANQISLSKVADSGNSGVAFGLSRTFGYLGAIISSINLKNIYQSGVNDASFFRCSVYALVSCVFLLILHIFSLSKSKVYNS